MIRLRDVLCARDNKGHLWKTLTAMQGYYHKNVKTQYVTSQLNQYGINIIRMREL